MELVVEKDEGSRLDAFLAARLSNLSRSRIQTLIREQHILRNGLPCKPREAVALGDRLQIEFPEPIP
ncbi:MAG: S4 domain-containing protein, partial [Verrucomicrobiales bacterium]